MESTLTKAIRLAQKGKYNEAASLLEPEIIQYRDSFNFLYTLGLCKLYSYNFSAAHDYLLKAREIKLRHPNTLLALGALYLKRAETRRAVSYYLEVKDIDNKNKTAKKALHILKKYAGSDDLFAWIESNKLKNLFPPFPYIPVKKSKIIVLVLSVVFICALSASLLFKFIDFKLPFSQNKERGGYKESALVAEDKIKPIETIGAYRYVLTEKQLFESYEKMRRFFNEQRDNAAMLEINRIIQSNAGDGIKNKARFLLSLLETPGFNNFTDNYNYDAVKKDPILHQNCFVKWSGMASGVIESENETVFDFLVGYDKKNPLRGVHKVTLPFAVYINSDEPLEIIAKVIPISEGEFSLYGSSIHQ